MYTLFKALVYACSSYPKICLPHRLDLSKDYEYCLLSGLLTLNIVYESVETLVEEYSSGGRSIGELNVGRNIGKAFIDGFRELGANFDLVLSASTVITIYTAVAMSKMSTNFHNALRIVYRDMMYGKPEETLEFVRDLRKLGGEIATALERANISERRIAVEGLRIYDVIELLGDHIPSFKTLHRVDNMLTVVNEVERLYRDYNDVNAALSMLSIALAKSELNIDIDTNPRDHDYVVKILKIDREYRKRGINLRHLEPYILVASLYLAITT